MKYCKPEAHSISATNAGARCVDGTTAAADTTCTVGPEVGVICAPGTSPSTADKCKAGTAAAGAQAQCSGGTAVGDGCYVGNVP